MKVVNIAATVSILLIVALFVGFTIDLVNDFRAEPTLIHEGELASVSPSNSLLAGSIALTFHDGTVVLMSTQVFTTDADGKHSRHLETLQIGQRYKVLRNGTIYIVTPTKQGNAE